MGVFSGTGRRLAAMLAASLLLGACAEGDPAERAERHLAAAEKAFAEGKTEAGMIELRNAVQLVPDDAEARLKLGEASLAAWRPATAEKELARALENGGDPRRAVPPLSRALILLGRPADALERIAAVTDAGDDPALRYPEIDALVMAGRLDEAEAILDRLAEDDPRTLIRQARIAAVRGEAVRALALAEQASARDDVEPEALLSHAEIVGYTTIEDARRALALIDRGLAIDPSAPSLRVARATALLRLGELDEATAVLDGLRADGLSSILAVHLRSAIALQAQDWEVAKDEAERILAEQPRYVPSLLIAGIAHAALGNDQQAVTHLQRFAGNPSAPPVALKALALANLRLGRGDAAMAALQNPALGDEDLDRTRMMVAASLADGDTARARALLEELVAGDPSDVRAATGLAALQMLGGDRENADALLDSLTENSASAEIADKVRIAMLQLRAGDHEAAAGLADAIRTENPDMAIGHTIAGLAALQARDTEAAAAAFRDALGRDRGDRTAALALAALLQRDGDREGARAVLDGALAEKPVDPRLLAAAVGLRLAANDKAAAESLLRDTARRHETAVDPKVVLARFLLNDGRAEDALRFAEDAALLGPERPDVLDTRARILQRLGRHAEAVPVLREFARLRPDRVEPEFLLARSLAESGDVPAAIASLGRVLELAPARQDARVILARLLLLRGENARAGEEIGKLALALPESAEVAELQAMHALTERRQDEAVAQYRRALELEPSPARTIALARAERATGNAGAAERLLADLVAGAPDNGTARLELARLYYGTGQAEKARAEYGRLVEAAPDNAALSNDFAWMLWENGQAREALGHAERAHGLAPDSPEIKDTLGVVLIDVGQPARAVGLLREAVAARPDNADMRFHLAQAHAAAGETDAARALLADLVALEGFGRREEARALLDSL